MLNRHSKYVFYTSLLLFSTLILLTCTFQKRAFVGCQIPDMEAFVPPQSILELCSQIWSKVTMRVQRFPIQRYSDYHPTCLRHYSSCECFQVFPPPSLPYRGRCLDSYKCNTLYLVTNDVYYLTCGRTRDIVAERLNLFYRPSIPRLIGWCNKKRFGVHP